MSSDESAKPHPAHKDRNPFDISRRSEEEVAAEIAARLSAWKQARSRSVGSAPSPASRPPQTVNTMVTPGVMSGVMAGTMNRAAGSHAATPHTFTPQRMPRFGEYAQERRTPEQRTPEQRTPDRDTREQAPPMAASSAVANSAVASPGVASPVVASPAVASSGALHRAVPAAPSLGRPTRAFPFRAGIQRPAKENPAAEFVVARPIETQPSAEIETPHVDSAPADALPTDQIAVESIVVEPPVDVAPKDVGPARSISIPAPVIETWEDEEAAIAAAAIPRLAIPERVAVPMAARHAAGGGTGWAIGLGAILLFLGVTLPAALWQQPPEEATDIAAIPPSDSAPFATAPASNIPAPSAPASGPLMEMTASSESAAPPPVPSLPGPADAIAEQKTQHVFAPVEALRSLQDGRDIAAAPINVPTAAGPAETPAAETSAAETSAAETSTGETSTGDLAGVAAGAVPTTTFRSVPRPFTPNAGATASATANPAHVLVAPPGAVKKPAARLKPVASAAVPPATKVAKPTAKVAKPVAQKPKVVKPASQGDPTVEQMFEQLIKTLSNGQPPNPATQPLPPGTRR